MGSGGSRDAKGVCPAPFSNFRTDMHLGNTVYSNGMIQPRTLPYIKYTKICLYLMSQRVHSNIILHGESARVAKSKNGKSGCYFSVSTLPLCASLIFTYLP